MQPQTATEPQPEFTDNTNFEPECALPGTALTCLNGLKHGATSRTLFIPGEHPQDFYNLLAESFATHQPATTENSAIVTDLVLARWYLWRRQRSHNKTEGESFADHHEPDTLTVGDLQKLALFDRYQTQAERTFARALKNVQSIEKNVLNEEKWRANHELQKAKFDLDRQRFELRQEQNTQAVEKKVAEAAKAAKQDSAFRRWEPLIPHGGLCVENGESFIQQTVSVSHEDGVTMIDSFHTSNQKVRELITNRDRYLVPPKFVLRDIVFNTAIPPEYMWVKNCLSEEALKTAHRPDGDIRLRLSFKKWSILAAKEDAILANQPTPPEIFGE